MKRGNFCQEVSFFRGTVPHLLGLFVSTQSFFCRGVVVLGGVFGVFVVGFLVWVLGVFGWGVFWGFLFFFFVLCVWAVSPSAPPPLYMVTRFPTSVTLVFPFPPILFSTFPGGSASYHWLPPPLLLFSSVFRYATPY